MQGYYSLSHINILQSTPNPKWLKSARLSCLTARVRTWVGVNERKLWEKMGLHKISKAVDCLCVCERSKLSPKEAILPRGIEKDFGETIQKCKMLHQDVLNSQRLACRCARHQVWCPSLSVGSEQNINQHAN